MGSTPCRKDPLKRKTQSSVQVNSDCAVVKVRIKSVRQKEAWTQAAKAAGMSGEFMSKAETGWTKAEGKCQAKERKAEREDGESSSEAERESEGQEA